MRIMIHLVWKSEYMNLVRVASVNQCLCVSGGHRRRHQCVGRRERVVAWWIILMWWHYDSLVINISSAVFHLNMHILLVKRIACNSTCTQSAPGFRPLSGGSTTPLTLLTAKGSNLDSCDKNAETISRFPDALANMKAVNPSCAWGGCE